jgi:hypothetical protein
MTVPYSPAITVVSPATGILGNRTEVKYGTRCTRHAISFIEVGATSIAILPLVNRSSGVSGITHYRNPCGTPEVAFTKDSRQYCRSITLRPNRAPSSSCTGVPID